MADKTLTPEEQQYKNILILLFLRDMIWERQLNLSITFQYFMEKKVKKFQLI